MKAKLEAKLKKQSKTKQNSKANMQSITHSENKASSKATCSEALGFRSPDIPSPLRTGYVRASEAQAIRIAFVQTSDIWGWGGVGTPDVPSPERTGDVWGSEAPNPRRRRFLKTRVGQCGSTAAAVAAAAAAAAALPVEGKARAQ